jgi:hypothetical protein
VVQLTDKSYLLLGANGTLVMDQNTGAPIMALANDPALIWQTGAEIRRQLLGVQYALQSKQSNLSWNGSQGPGSPDDQREIKNMQTIEQRLNNAYTSLGNVSGAPATPASPPVAGAIEVFASVWMTPDGKYLVVNRPDGSLVYIDGKHWYSDAGVTPLKQPYPSKFMSVATAYLSNLATNSNATKASLTQDIQEANDHLQGLQQDLQQYQAARANPSGGGMVDYGPNQIPVAEALRRTNHQIRRVQTRIAMLQKQIDQLPQETELATKTLASLKVHA